MTKAVVIYHSTFGHTRAQAEAVAEGLSESKGIDVALIEATEIDEHWETLHEADSIVFGAPTYLGSVSSKFKTFMDKTSQIWAEQKWANKFAAGFTSSSCASGDKLQTLMQLTIFAAQHGMNWITLGLMPGNMKEDDDPTNLNRLGGWLGAMAQCSDDNLLITKSDQATAKHLGKRVANLTIRLSESRKAVEST